MTSLSFSAPIAFLILPLIALQLLRNTMPTVS